MTLAVGLYGGLMATLALDRAMGEDARTVRAFVSGSRGTPSIAFDDHHRVVLEALAEALRQGESARSTEVGTLYYAVQLLGYLPATVPLPEITIDVDGDIELEWYRGPRRTFSIRVTRDGTIYYAGLAGHATFHGTEVLREGIPGPVSAGIDRIISEPSF